MMGSRGTLTPLKDFFACVVLRQWSKEDNPILGIQGILHLVMGMARIFQGGGGGSHPGNLPDCLCILFLLTDIINERGMGFGRGSERQAYK